MNEGEEQILATAGERLRAAREALGMSIEDVATSTRIPTRHLSSLETGDFDRLPAPTYSVGFARSYAAAVGLDRTEIGEQMRGEIGGTRLAPHQAEQFEPLDPARSMPRWLIFAVIGAILLVALVASWLSNRSMNAPDNVVAEEPAPTAAAPAIVPSASAAQAVALTATADAWVDIRDGATILKQGVMKADERFEIPPTATAPTLTTAKAEALRISVGATDAPSIGPAATRLANVSLLPANLLRPRPAAPKPVVATPAPKPAALRPVVATPRPRPTTPAPATVPANTAEPAPPPQ